MIKQLATFLCLLTLTAFGLAACGDDDGAGSTETTGGSNGEGSGGTVSLEADPNGALAYTTDTAEVAAGAVTIEFDNPASLPHDVVVENGDGDEIARTDIVTGDSTSTTTQLEPGEYVFFCSVDGHREQGMEGVLTAEQ